jgi:hypothetical protein
MPILDSTDPKKLPVRPTVNSFCDGCSKLTYVTQIRTVRGIKWLCSGCSPALTHLPVTPNSPPPSDPAPSPELDQWIEQPLPELTPEMEAYLAGEEYVPRDVLDEAIEQFIESEPIGGEQGDGADDARRAS